MRGSKSVWQDTRAGFRVVVDSADVSNRDRRKQLAAVINSTRKSMLMLLDMPVDLAGMGDWTKVRRTIQKKINTLNEPEKAKKLKVLDDRLLDAEAELVEGNLRLVLMVVRRYTRGAIGALEEMDFVQEGCEGLLDAVRRFDFSGSTGFISYALLRIRKRVLLAMEKQPRLVRIPAHVISKGRYLRGVIDRFTASMGRPPRPDEIEEEIGSSMDWSILLSLSETVYSIHNPIRGEGIPLEEQLPSPKEEEGVDSLAEIVEKGLQMLDKRAKFILVMRYGLLDGEPHTLSSISEILGISTERIRQIEKKSIAVLRHDFNSFCNTDRL